jgi:hypothetical protein
MKYNLKQKIRGQRLAPQSGRVLYLRQAVSSQSNRMAGQEASTLRCWSY